MGVVEKLKDKNFQKKLQQLNDDAQQFYREEHIKQHNAKIRKKIKERQQQQRQQQELNNEEMVDDFLFK